MQNPDHTKIAVYNVVYSHGGSVEDADSILAYLAATCESDLQIRACIFELSVYLTRNETSWHNVASLFLCDESGLDFLFTQAHEAAVQRDAEVFRRPAPIEPPRPKSGAHPFDRVPTGRARDMPNPRFRIEGPRPAPSPRFHQLGEGPRPAPSPRFHQLGEGPRPAPRHIPLIEHHAASRSSGAPQPSQPWQSQSGGNDSSRNR